MADLRAPIAPPENFPVRWPHPAFEQHLWTWDQMHQPHPLTPLTATFEAPAFAEGSTRGFQALQMPATFHVAIINCYAYQSMQFSRETTEFPPRSASWSL